jgi:hypothetical protein
MRSMRTSIIAASIIALLPSVARAVDAGETKPKYSVADSTNPSTTTNLVPLTSASGNLKGIACLFSGTGGGAVITINIYVDGGAAQALSLDASGTTFQEFPTDNASREFTGWIPMNVRFGTSLKVDMVRGGGPYTFNDLVCAASWALD